MTILLSCMHHTPEAAVQQVRNAHANRTQIRVAWILANSYQAIVTSAGERNE